MRFRAATTAIALAFVFSAAACDRKSNGSNSAPTTAKQTTVAPALTNATPQGPRTAVYDLLERTYASYTTTDDPLGFPMKVRNLSSNPSRFWRGAKEIFYEWARTNTTDWLADQDSYLRIHGDLHPGNMGLYHSAGKFGRHVAFGAVDFDDSARLPFQIELLQGVITFELLANHRKIKLKSEQVDQIVSTMIDAYREALTSGQNPTDLLEEDRWVGKMLKKARRREYAQELKKYVQGEEFVSVIKDDEGHVKEMLESVKGKGSFAEAIEGGLLNSPDARDLFKDADVRKRDVRDIARRTQLESAGSEGLQKYLVLLSNKKIPDKQLILYLKQQIPTSAERVGLISKDPRPPGRRSSEDMHDLSHPPAYFNSWCEWNGSSFRLSIKEPWSETLDAADVDTFEDLKHMVRIWGAVAGSVHRQGDQTVEHIRARLTPELAAQLRDRGMVYTRKALDDARLFLTDARVKEQINKAEAGLRELELRSR
jgi:hypothetical protein